MKSKLRCGMLCSNLLFLALVSRSDAQEPPPQQEPAPSAPQPQPSPSPLPPIRIQQHDTSGDAYSIEPLFWLTRTAPVLKLGQLGHTKQTEPGDLDFPGKSKYGLGAALTFRTGSENSVQVSYFRIKRDGITIADQDLILFNNPFVAGDVLATSYTVENFKLSWNYLTYPHPSNGAKFRVKTLWEIQYLHVDTVTQAPLDTNATLTAGGKTILYPTLGLGIEYHPGRHVVLEAKGSGFGLPHRADIWDAEASFILRFGRLEALLGGKGYHFKTSTKADQYFTGTLLGPAVGLRWIFR